MSSQIGDEIGDITMTGTEADSQTQNEAGSSTSADDGSSTSAATPSTHEQASRQSNLQRIQQRKQQVYGWPHNKKLLKLAIYSACQTPDCACNGWKTPVPQQPNKGNNRADVQPLASFTDPCRNCNHILEKHVTQLQGLPVAEVNRLLGTVVDVENIFMSMHREDDHDTKRVYYYLFKILRKCILTRSHPRIEGPLGQPPFERPSIAKAITNFVLYKFNSLPQREWQTMYDLAKMFLHCFNHWNFETPSVRKLQVSNPEDISAYQINYTRWLVFCHVPAFCDSLPHYDTSLVFGRTLLRAVFKSVCRQLMDKCHSERDRMPPEKRVLVLTHFPRFLALLEEEIFSATSPIWDPEYKQVPPTHLQAILDNKSSTIKAESVKRGSESRSSAEPPSGAKRRRLVDDGDDVSERTVAEIVATIDDPNYMCGPDGRPKFPRLPIDFSQVWVPSKKTNTQRAHTTRIILNTTDRDKMIELMHRADQIELVLVARDIESSEDEDEESNSEDEEPVEPQGEIDQTTAIFNRFLFYSIEQARDEKFHQYFYRLKRQAELCCFEDAERTMVDKIVHSCYSKQLRRRIIEAGDYATLEYVITTANRIEIMKQLEASDDVELPDSDRDSDDDSNGFDNEPGISSDLMDRILGISALGTEY